MKHSLLPVIVASSLFVALPACGQQALDEPVTPVAEAPLATGWKSVEVVGDLVRPWGLAFLPDADHSDGLTMLVTEKPGRLRVVENGTLRDSAVSGVPEVFAGGQGGLMDVVLHPHFDDTRWVYLTYSAGDARSNFTAMARGRLTDDLAALEDVEVLFEVKERKRGGQHFGSRILWLPDDTMLLSIGDGGNPPSMVEGKLSRLHAQDTHAHLGKTLRLDENGAPAPANPFMSDMDAYGAVFTLGHRNIQGMDMHPVTRDVWATEHGARGGDELNKIVAGSNYGWPEATYSREYAGPRISDKTTLEGAVDPVVVWTPCIAPSGLAFYTGDGISDWNGDLFAGGLVLRQVRRIKFDENHQPIPGTAGQETLQFRSRIRDVRNGPDGFLYVLTDETPGQVLRIEAE
ncbi:MAG: PQQ-dependent sugar dehydrogenase [Planctomycetota bacterium]